MSNTLILPPPVIKTTLKFQQGPAGASSAQYTHNQPVAAEVWTINHNLGYRPAVSVLTPGGMLMMAEIVHASASQALAYFDAPVAGIAVCS